MPITALLYRDGLLFVPDFGVLFSLNYMHLCNTQTVDANKFTMKVNIVSGVSKIIVRGYVGVSWRTVSD